MKIHARGCFRKDSIKIVTGINRPWWNRELDIDRKLDYLFIEKKKKKQRSLINLFDICHDTRVISYKERIDSSYRLEKKFVRIIDLYFHSRIDVKWRIWRIRVTLFFTVKILIKNGERKGLFLQVCNIFLTNERIFIRERNGMKI